MPVDVHKVRHGYLHGAGAGAAVSRLVATVTAFATGEAVTALRTGMATLASAIQQSATWRGNGSREQSARVFLAQAAGLSAHHNLDVHQLIRKARAAAHPDRHHGDQSLWRQVEQARTVLVGHA